MSKTVTGGALVINCYGDSMTYGFDNSSTTGDLQPGINGSSATRALYQYPEALAAAMTKAGYSVTVNNYGFPGDTAVQGKTRFPSAVACDIAFLMFGHNDATEVSGNPTTSPADFKDAMDFTIKREKARGAFVVLMTPPRLKESNLTGQVNRQRWMRVFESIIDQLGVYYGIPVISVDELVGHRGADVYSDNIHFNKYGYNEWGWNLSAAIIQRSSLPKRIGHGTVIHASGSSITGTQTAISGKTRLLATTAVPLTISGYFEEDLVARAVQVFSTAAGGTQRGKITLSGGTRNDTISQTRVGLMDASSPQQRRVNSDVIRKGYRTFFLEVASTTTLCYFDRVEFVRPQSVFTDTARAVEQYSPLTGRSIGLEANRWIIDDQNPLLGDFTIVADLTTAPTVGTSAGISLVSEYAESTGLPSFYLNVVRIPGNAIFVRLATPTNADTSFSSAFPGAATLIKIVRSGDVFSIYANDVLVETRTYAFKRLNPALFGNAATNVCNSLLIS
jgi:lysophospholipase L1-like esterase